MSNPHSTRITVNCLGEPRTGEFRLVHFQTAELTHLLPSCNAQSWGEELHVFASAQNYELLLEAKAMHDALPVSTCATTCVTDDEAIEDLSQRILVMLGAVSHKIALPALARVVAKIKG